MLQEVNFCLGKICLPLGRRWSERQFEGDMKAELEFLQDPLIEIEIMKTLSNQFFSCSLCWLDSGRSRTA